MPSNTLWNNNSLNLISLPFHNLLLSCRRSTTAFIFTFMAGQPDPLLALAIYKDNFVFPRAEKVSDDKVVRVAVEGLPTFIEEEGGVSFKL